jgi:YVTN family beta-propeller protein
MKSYFLFLGFVLICFPLWAQKQTIVSTLQVPGREAYTHLDSNGVSVLASGRFVRPVGTVTRITRAPFGLAITPDGQTALALHHNGALTVIGLKSPGAALRIPDYAGKTKPISEAPFLGVVFAADSHTACLSGGDKGTVVIFDLISKQKTGEISLDGTFAGMNYQDSYTSDIALNPRNNRLYALDRGNNRLVTIDLATRTLLASVPVGRIPFGIALSPDGSRAFVANVGLYEYPLLPGVTPTNKDSMMLHFPAYATDTKEAENGITLPNGRVIPGLGSALAAEAMSVWVVDLNRNTVEGKFKTGYQIGQVIEDAEIVGGASPNSVAVGSRFAYVSNASNDLISIIDWKKNKLAGEIKLKSDKRIDRYSGMMPFGCTLSADEKTLYVALLGFNAVAVVDAAKKKVRGYIPTGWGPTRVALSPDGRQLYILSARGQGAGPNGGLNFKAPPQGTYIGDIQQGTFQVVDIPDDNTLKTWTAQVLANTFTAVKTVDDGKNPCPARAGLRKSPIRHIVYITKENRTYDEVLGQLSNANGDASLARFGENVTVNDTIKGARVSPNHLKIARQWAFSDNFYCDSDASIHGHHWMVGTVPNEYVEANSAASARFMTFSKAPGRRFPKTTGAMDPEDYNEIGGLWENLKRHNINFYNFGEANEHEGNFEEWNTTQFGTAHPVPWPMPKALFPNTSHNYAGFNTNIPDQFRMDQFEQEFAEKWLSGKDTMPQLIAMQLPNDHGADPRPADGYPFRHSYMADNDLALGRILHFLSRTPYWASTLVVVTEDDPQGGVDHLDAHRSILLLAGPYVKRSYVSHLHGNFGAILKMIYNILNIPNVNQYDATATLLNDFFTDKPDLTRYDIEPSDKRVFDPQKALNRYNKTFNWRKIQQGPKLDDEHEQRKEHYKKGQ